jgi:uncharacterized membrane protein YeaQ/YmgE (transglycosylase-associated protein family)
MGLVAWLVLGAVAGYLAGMFVKGDERLGVIGHIFLGIVGAIVGGFIANQLTGGDYLQLLVGGAAAAALWAAIGLGAGALLRNQVGAIVGLCVWMLLVESTSESFVPGFGRLLPGGAGLALAGNVDELSAAIAALVLVLYAAAISAAGWLATLRRDIA